MSVGIGTAIAIGAGVTAAGGIASSAIGANAASNASNQQISAEKSAEQQTQANQAPYLAAGQQSLSTLMGDLNNGTFGPGSIPSFTAPTLAAAEATPGYQFSQQQGDKGILEAQAASGGAITGGTAKSLSGFNQNLAQTDYSNVFDQALSTYQAALSGQNQAFNQLYAPVALGEAATQNQNASLSQLLQAQGNSAAAGTIGASNAITSGIGNTTNSISSSLSLGTLLKNLNGGGGTTPTPTLGDANTLGMTSPSVFSASQGGATSPIFGLDTTGIGGLPG